MSENNRREGADSEEPDGLRVKRRLTSNTGDRDSSVLESRVCDVVYSVTEPHAVVLYKRGEEARLPELKRRSIWDFPTQAVSADSGSHRRQQEALIVRLEALLARGADYFVVPHCERAWLEEQEVFDRHVRSRYRLLFVEEGNCVIFALREPCLGARLQDVMSECLDRLGPTAPILDWTLGLDLAVSFPGQTVFSPPTEADLLPYLDKSIDLVVVECGRGRGVSEARRVASGGVVTVAANAPEAPRSVVVEWVSEHRSNLSKTSIIVAIECQSRLDSWLRTLVGTLPGSLPWELILSCPESRRGEVGDIAAATISDRTQVCAREGSNCVGLYEVAAAKATGETLVFLPSRFVPRQGWLLPLLSLLAARPDAGAVTGRVLRDDGRLQSAGGLLLPSGVAFGLGEGDTEVDDFSYNHIREIDYCPGGFLAAPTRIFQAVGGFDADHENPDYACADYSLALLDRGHRTYLQPASRVIDLAGDRELEARRAWAENPEVLEGALLRLQQKWGALLAGRPEWPATK